MNAHGTDGPEHDHWPPTETPESRMTGEGGPPPDEDQEKTDADGPEYAVTGHPANAHGQDDDPSRSD